MSPKKDVSARSNGTVPVTYEIVVKGTLSEATLGGIDARGHDTGDGKMLIVLEVIDQAHLHGVFGWLQDRNIEVERVNPV